MIKFKAKVNQGKIEIPEIYQDNLQMVEAVEVIIYDWLTNRSSGIIQRLLEHLVETQNFVPFIFARKATRKERRQYEEE